MPVLRRIGRVTVYASDAVAAPFAARMRGRAYIVVPSALVADRARLRLVLAHEAHHHRRRDLHAAAAFQLVRALFFWNPLLARGQRAFAELEDLACDRRVLRSGRVSPVEYARALVWAAEAAVVGPAPTQLAARGMAHGSLNCLKRRIAMLREMHTAPGRAHVWLLGVAASGLLVATSWMVHAAVTPPPLTRAEVTSQALRIEQRSGFPVLADARVTAQLNAWRADAEARASLHHALDRMPTYRDMIEAALRTRGLPVELVSIALAESRFDNAAHPNTPVERRSAGIWHRSARRWRCCTPGA